MTEARLPLIAVVGPTGTGKSELAQTLAEWLHGVVLSADSMQVYRGLDIGTAKIPLATRRVPHFGLDIADIRAGYSAAEYQRYARSVIEEQSRAGHPTILCGGTGLYVRAALDCFDFPPGAQEDNTVRMRYEQYARENGDEALHALLTERDAASAALIHPHNRRRVVRALELNEQGESYAERSAGFTRFDSYYPAFRLGLRMEREALYRRLNARVDAMMAAGLLAEVTALRAQGFAKALTARQAIGYKELLTFLEGECSLEEAVEHIKQSTRRYAKRQMTFFNADPRVYWLDIDGLNSDDVAQRAGEQVASAFDLPKKR